jgi:twitching motility two-component system response regulator PilG
MQLIRKMGKGTGMSCHILHNLRRMHKIALLPFTGEDHTSLWEGHSSPRGAHSSYVDDSTLDTLQEGTPSYTFLPGSTTQDHPTFSPAIKSVFVIDDSATIRKITETVLQQAGYETRSFRDGVEAMKWFAKPGSQPPDLILVDIGLPKMDGYEVIRTIKARPRFANTICIVLSGRDSTVDKLKGRLAGAKAYVTKPFTPQILLTAVRAHLTSETVYEEVGH